MRKKKQQQQQRPADYTQEILVIPAVLQPQLRPENVTLEYLHTYREKFSIAPPYQRQQIWPLIWCQQLMDSIFQGDPIGRFEGHEVVNGKGEKLWIIDDGHQRLTTIYDFLDNKFPTMTLEQKLHAEPGTCTAPVEPGTYFDDLSVTARNTLLNYQIQIDRVRDMTDAQRIERFLRIQNQAPLSSAERLAVYDNVAQKACTLIEHHPFWKACYIGKNNRQQVFQSSLYLLALHLSGTHYLDLPGAFVRALACGTYDLLVTNTVVNAVMARLDTMLYVYDGLQITERAPIIAMYQSVVILQEAGCMLTPADKGKLVPWIAPLIAASKHTTLLSNYNMPMQKLRYKSGQRAFWEKHKPEVLRLFGLHAPERVA
jgi:hypothetical protein